MSKKRCLLQEGILKNFPGDSVFLYPNLGLILTLFDVLGSGFLVGDCDTADFDRPFLRGFLFLYLSMGVYIIAYALTIRVKICPDSSGL